MDRIVDRCQLEEAAVEYMVSQNVRAIVPSFSAALMWKTTRLRVHFSMLTEDIVQDGVDGRSTDPSTLEKLGHLASMAAWQLQERRGLGDGEQVQNHYCYTRHRAPLPNEVIHVVGKANATAMGTHQLCFSIFTYDNDRRRVPIGSGHSSLTIVPVDSQPPPLHDPAHDTSDSSSEGSDSSSDESDSSSEGSQSSSDGSDSSSDLSDHDSDLSVLSDWSMDPLDLTPPFPQSPTGEQPPEEQEIGADTGILLANAILALDGSPRTSSQGLEPGSDSKIATGSSESVAPPPALSEVPRPSILRELSTPDENPRKRRRSVSSEGADDVSMRFMLVNVIGSRPECNDTLEKRLKEIGVTAKDVKFEHLPIKKEHSYVFYFNVSTDNEKRKLENEVQKRKWSELFDVERLCSDSSPPFFWPSYPIESCVEAIFLAAGKPPLADDFAEQLNDKRCLGRIVNDKGLMKHVAGGLTVKGTKMFHEKIKPSAVL